MFKKVSIILLGAASMMRPTIAPSAELRQAFLTECSKQIYQERIRDRELVSAAALKIVGYIPTDCLKRFNEVKRYLVMENNNYFHNRLGDEKYRLQLDSELDAGVSVSFSPSALSQQERMRNISGKTDKKVNLETIRGFSTISPDQK